MYNSLLKTKTSKLIEKYFAFFEKCLKIVRRYLKFYPIKTQVGYFPLSSSSAVFLALATKCLESVKFPLSDDEENSVFKLIDTLVFKKRKKIMI